MKKVLLGLALIILIGCTSTSDIIEVQPTVINSNPTYNEVVYFITQDRTNENTYNNVMGSGRYVCVEFACDMQSAAIGQNMRAGYAIIRISNVSHAVVVFDTIDNGRWFVDPQTDTLMRLEEGSKYPGMKGTIIYIIIHWEPYWGCNLDYLKES